MKCLAGGRVAAHLGHVAADGDLLDARFLQARWPVPATMRLGSSVSSPRLTPTGPNEPLRSAASCYKYNFRQVLSR